MLTGQIHHRKGYTSQPPPQAHREKPDSPTLTELWSAYRLAETVELELGGSNGTGAASGQPGKDAYPISSPAGGCIVACDGEIRTLRERLHYSAKPPKIPFHQMPERMGQRHSLIDSLSYWTTFSSIVRCGLCFIVAAHATACKPNDSPFKAENEQLRRQVAKQESVIASIQEGTKVMQQQIDLLNRELREAKKRADQAETERKDMTVKLEAEQKTLAGKLVEERRMLGGKLDAERKTLTAKQDAERKALSARVEAEAAENRRLIAETRRLTEANARATPAIRVEEKGGQTAELSEPLPVVTKAIEDVLTKNGYNIRVVLKTDQRAIYVTERKTSSPSSIEVSGFRNEYLLSVQSLPNKGTRIIVKAAFEKLAQGGKLLTAGPEEIAEIERRLLAEVSKVAGASGKA